MKTHNETILTSINILRHFIDKECDTVGVNVLKVKSDNTRLLCDWGYFEDGLNEIERWARTEENK